MHRLSMRAVCFGMLLELRGAIHHRMGESCYVVHQAVFKIVPSIVHSIPSVDRVPGSCHRLGGSRIASVCRTRCSRWRNGVGRRARRGTVRSSGNATGSAIYQACNEVDSELDSKLECADSPISSPISSSINSSINGRIEACSSHAFSHALVFDAEWLSADRAVSWE